MYADFASFGLWNEPVNSRKQTIYMDFFSFQVLEKKPPIEYNSGVVDSF